MTVETDPPVAVLSGTRVAVISASDHGGAGGASLRCVEGLREAGIDARLLCLFSRSEKPYVSRLPVKAPFRQAFDADGTGRDIWRQAGVLTRDEDAQLRARELFSKTGCVVDYEALAHEIAEADIIHLHWVTGILDYAALGQVIGSRPVVWTLHDMNPFTGGCHYSEGCFGYQDGCLDCPLVSGESQLPHRAWQEKMEAFAQLPSLSVICPSHWLADHVRQAPVFSGRPVHVAPNVFPGAAFRATPKILARQRLGLPLEGQLIAFGADRLGNRRKGADLLRASLTALASATEEDVAVLFFGGGSLDLPVRGHNMGYVDDPETLSLIYAAADVFAFPSREDNAPQVVIEAMASGTPVVGFPVGFLPDIVEHKETGYIAIYENTKDFAAGLAWALAAAPGSQIAMRRSARAHAMSRRYTLPDYTVAKYLHIYGSVHVES